MSFCFERKTYEGLSVKKPRSLTPLQGHLNGKNTFPERQKYSLAALQFRALEDTQMLTLLLL
jgi:hypothetical protein